MELGDQGSQGGGASLAPGTVVLSNLLGFSFQHPGSGQLPDFPFPFWPIHPLPESSLAGKVTGLWC